MTERVDEIAEQFRGLSYQELKELNNKLVDRLRAERKYEAKQKLDELQPGDRVEVIRGGEVEWTGEVLETKRTRAVVRQDKTMKEWNVPATMIRKL